MSKKICLAALLLCPCIGMSQQATQLLVDAPQPTEEVLMLAGIQQAPAPMQQRDPAAQAQSSSSSSAASQQTSGQTTEQTPEQRHAQNAQSEDLNSDGTPIRLEQKQPKRILGFMPNFRSVSAGAKPHPPGWGYNFKIATRQSFDYSSFVFLGLTSISAEGINSHPVLGKGVHGMWSYSWRGFLDKTDGTYIQAWFLPSLLHEDTRYYPLGKGHRIITRALYVISRQGVTRTYGGRQTPNISALGGKVLTQLVSRQYYPQGATDFSVLATKFGYAAMRDVMFTSIREFYPDIAAHFIRKHREKLGIKCDVKTQIC